MRTGIDKHTMVFFLGMQTFLLLEEDEGCTRTKRNGKYDKTNYKTDNAVCDDKANDGSTDSTCSPSDVATLESHKFERLLQSLEHGITYVLIFIADHRHDVSL